MRKCGPCETSRDWNYPAFFWNFPIFFPFSGTFFGPGEFRAFQPQTLNLENPLLKIYYTPNPNQPRWLYTLTL